MSDHLLGKIINWEDKKLTGLILFCLNLLFYLCIFAGYSIVNILSLILFTNISALNFYSFLCTDQQLNTNPYFWILFSLFEVLQVLAYIIQKIKTIECALQIILAGMLAYYISSIISLCIFIWAATNIAFIVSYCYSDK